MKKRTHDTRSKQPEPSAASLQEIPEIDFAKVKFQRGRFANVKFTNVRLIDADLEALFPDSDSVNRALRAALAVAEAVPRKARGKGKKSEAA